MILLFIFIGIYVYKSIVVNDNIRKIAQNKILIMGDSQMQRLLPECFDDKTFNFASSGEHYYFTYCKLSSLLQINDYKIEKIILGISAHNFAPVYSKLFDLTTGEGEKSLKSYLYFVDLKNTNFISSSDYFSKVMCEAVIKSPDWGGVIRSNARFPSDSVINISLKMHYSNSKFLVNSFRNQMYYLEKISELCKSKSVDLYLVSTPYHSVYTKNVSNEYFIMLSTALSKLKFDHYTNFINQYNDSVMADGNHLNYIGAKLISQRINTILPND